MFVFLLVCLFWTGAISLASTHVGAAIAIFCSLPLGFLLVALGVSNGQFAFLFIAIFAALAIANAAKGVARAINGNPNAWSSWSWAVSFAAFPLVVYLSLETFGSRLA